MTDDFFAYCDVLWRNWLDGQLPEPHPFVQKWFDLDAAPEPYLIHKVGDRPLVGLLTNPGPMLDVQARAAILRGGPIPADKGYDGAAVAFARWYSENLPGKAARRRNEALLALAEQLGYDGLLTAECCPFHSPELEEKAKLVGVFEDDLLLRDYVARLRQFLRPRPVVVVSAVATNKYLHPTMNLSPWLAWQASLVGIRLDRATFVKLTGSSDKITAAALVDVVDGMPKALSMMMGGNNLPGDGGLSELAAAMRHG
jgi:hypothetical protein